MKTATILTTDTKTFPIQRQEKNDTNLSLFLATVAYQNKGQYLSSGNFIAEARRHGLTNSDATIIATLGVLAGIDCFLVHKRDVLLYKIPTKKMKQQNGWDNRTQKVYKFNTKGTMCFKEAKRTVKISKITRATMLVKIH